MSLLFRFCVIASAVAAICLIPAVAVLAQDQIPWAENLEQAQRTATEQRKLLLLHFYNDHCPPCERLEQTVFNQPQVVEAIAKNYVPVKIHAGAQPRVAEHYQVNRWPTDVICTAAGLEVYRTVSPLTAEKYSAFCDGLALQAGVGAGRQWASALPVAGKPVYDEAARVQAAINQLTGGIQQTAGQTAQQAGATGQGYVAQANAAGQTASQQVDQRVAGATQQMNQSAQQAQTTTQNWTRQLTDTSRQVTGAGAQIGSTFQNTARDLRSQWDPANLRAPNPAAASIQNPLAADAAQQSPTTSIYQSAPQQQPAPAAATLPTANPWLGQQQAQPEIAASAPAPSTQPPTTQPPTTQPAWQPSGTAASGIAATTAGPTAAQPALTPTESQQRQLVPASQAPPIALEGYCTVTLLDAKQWQKADARFGAIHRGNTYLFRSEAEQKKFLADPDRYCPVLSGYDPVIFAQRGELVPGARSYGIKYQGRLFLFADVASRDAFEKSPRDFAAAAHTAMLQAEKTPSLYR